MLTWAARSQIVCRSCSVPRLTVPQVRGIRNRSRAPFSQWQTARARTGRIRQDSNGYIRLKQLQERKSDSEVEPNPRIVSSSQVELNAGDGPKEEEQFRIRKIKKSFALPIRWRTVTGCAGFTRQALETYLKTKQAWKRKGKPKTVPGPKIVSLGSLKRDLGGEDGRKKYNLEEFSRTWSARFASLDIFKPANGNTGTWRYRKYAGLHLSDEEIVAEWLKIPKTARMGVWMAFTLQALRARPLHGLRLLAATMLHPDMNIPRYTIDDCLYHLTCYFLADAKDPSRIRVNSIQNLLCRLARASTAGSPFRINDTTVFWVLKHCTNDQAYQVFEALNQGSVALHGHTWLHLLSRYVDQGNIAASLQCLDRVVASGLDLQSAAVMNCCVHLLRVHTATREWYQVQSNILTRLLELGVRPNLPMWNVMLYNAIKAGDHSTAWSMYEIGRQNNLEPDGITYRTLLILARNSLEKETLHKVVDHAESQRLLPTDQKLAFHVLYTIFVIEFKRTIFDSMFAIYSRYFDQTPLRDLGIDEPRGTQREHSPQDQQQLSPSRYEGLHAGIERHEDLRKENSSYQVISPQPAIIGIMIMGFLRQNSTSPHLMDFYNMYHSLVKAGHPIISHISRTPHVANAFMQALKYNKDTFRFLTTIFAHMQEPRAIQSPGHSVVKHHDQTAGRPDLYSWNILNHAALLQHEKVAATVIHAQMKKHGVSRDVVSWNTVVGGYAKMQDTDATLDAVKQMRAEGVEADDITVKALERLHDQAAIRKALKLWDDGGHEAPTKLGLERGNAAFQRSTPSDDDDDDDDADDDSDLERERALHNSYAERRRCRFDEE